MIETSSVPKMAGGLVGYNRFPYLYPQNSKAGFLMTEKRKYAILFAATLLCARKLAELDSDKPSPAKVYAINTAIEKAAFIMDRIDEKWQSRNEP
jgi:hypothetical protein